jgi:hypothetical protein
LILKSDSKSSSISSSCSRNTPSYSNDWLNQGYIKSDIHVTKRISQWIDVQNKNNFDIEAKI